CALGARLLPRRRRRLVDGDRPLRRLRRRSDPPFAFASCTHRVHEALHAEDAADHADDRHDDARRALSARAAGRVPRHVEPAARVGGRLVLRRRRDGDDRARVPDAGERGRALRAPQATARPARDPVLDEAVHVHSRHHGRDAGRDARDHDKARQLSAQPSLLDRKLPPVTEIGAAAMVAIAVGVIYNASYLPKHAQTGVAIAILLVAAALELTNVVLLARIRDFAW